jgi:hypothetical protein
MSVSKRAAIVAAVVGSISLVSVAGADQTGRAAEAIVMTPGQGLSLDIGSKHAVGYFETKEAACHLTVVLADVEGGLSGTDSPGTRIISLVAPGSALRLDAAKDKSAEFFCGPAGNKMNARIFDRTSYRDLRS